MHFRSIGFCTLRIYAAIWIYANLCQQKYSACFNRFPRSPSPSPRLPSSSLSPSRAAFVYFYFISRLRSIGRTFARPPTGIFTPRHLTSRAGSSRALSRIYIITPNTREHNSIRLIRRRYADINFQTVLRMQIPRAAYNDAFLSPRASTTRRITARPIRQAA